MRRHGYNAAATAPGAVADERDAAAAAPAPIDTVPRRAGRTARIRASISAVPGELRMLLAVAAVLGLAWAVAMAPFQGPDELEHFGYVQRLGETAKPPSASTGERSVSTEESEALQRLGFFSLRGVAAAREGWNPLEQREWERVERELPPSARDDGEGPNSAAKNPPLY